MTLVRFPVGEEFSTSVLDGCQPSIVLKIDDHVTETANKAKQLFHALARLGGQGWGYQAVNYIVLYKVLFQSICAYAAHGWARRLRQRHQRQLLAAQRQALIRTTKVYATASTDCLSVVVLTCMYRGGYTDIGSLEDYQLSSEM